MRKTWPEDMWTEDGSIRGAMGMSRRGRTLRTIETYKSDREQLSEAFWASILFLPSLAALYPPLTSSSCATLPSTGALMGRTSSNHQVGIR